MNSWLLLPAVESQPFVIDAARLSDARSVPAPRNAASRDCIWKPGLLSVRWEAPSFEASTHTAEDVQALAFSGNKARLAARAEAIPIQGIERRRAGTAESPSCQRTQVEGLGHLGSRSLAIRPRVPRWRWLRPQSPTRSRMENACAESFQPSADQSSPSISKTATTQTAGHLFGQEISNRTGRPTLKHDGNPASSSEMSRPKAS
jgi:hypothetical protein